MAFSTFPALQIRQPNIAGTLLAAEQIKGVRQRNAMLDLERDQAQQSLNLRQQILAGGQPAVAAPAGAGGAGSGGQNAMLGLPPAAQGGAPQQQPRYQPGEAMRRLWVIDPDGASKLQAGIRAMDEDQRTRHQHMAEQSGRLALTVLGAPEAERPLYYRAALKAAQQNGLDITGLPPEYGPEVERDLRIRVGMAQAVKEMIEAERPPENFQQAPGGGYEVIPGSAADPAYLAQKAAAERAPDRTLVEVYDPDSPTGRSYAPRSQATGRAAPPASGGGLTQSQIANNSEIDQARRTLDGMNLTKSDILRRTQKTTDTGRENPNYDPTVERLVRMATQRKVGEDADYNLVFQRYLGEEPPPVPGIIRPAVPLQDLGGPAPAAQPTAPAATPPAAAPGRGAPLAPRPSMRRAPEAEPAANRPIEQMTVEDLAAFITSRGGEAKLTPEEAAAIDARLKVLGF